MFNYLHKILVSYFKVIEQLCRTISEVMNCFSSPSGVYISDEAKTKRYVCRNKCIDKYRQLGTTVESGGLSSGK